jgi:hypothetical protein
MTNVVSLDSRRPDPHVAGPAKCLACGKEWVSVAPLGTFTLECPECHTERGVYVAPIGMSTDYSLWTCTIDGCGCQHMTIAKHYEGGYWIACCKCGALHSIGSVFP